MKKSAPILGFETQRQWSEKAIARTSPVLLCLFSLVTVLALQLSQGGQIPVPASAGWAFERRKPAVGVPTRLDFSRRPHGGGRYRASSADPASSKTPCTSRNLGQENQETFEMSESSKRTDQEAKAPGRTASMHVSEESDHVIVARNPLNKDGPPSAENRARKLRERQIRGVTIGGPAMHRGHRPAYHS